MARGNKRSKRRGTKASTGSTTRRSLLKKKKLQARVVPHAGPIEVVDSYIEQQLKQYEEALQYFQQQKFHKAKLGLEKVIAGPSKELADRAGMHLRVCEQRILRQPEKAPRSAEEYYQQGVAMMNLGRWDDAREHLQHARKLAPRSDYIVYAMAALDCLTGEAEAAMDNLKLAIEMRPENRYHARNDEDFAFLQEDPRFTELLYPEREGAGN